MSDIPYDTFKGPVCRGHASFGSNCGQCEKCKWLQAQETFKAVVSGNPPVQAPDVVDSPERTVAEVRIRRMLASVAPAVDYGQIYFHVRELKDLIADLDALRAAKAPRITPSHHMDEALDLREELQKRGRQLIQESEISGERLVEITMLREKIALLRATQNRWSIMLQDAVDIATRNPTTLAAFNSPILQLFVHALWQHNHPEQLEFSDDEARQYAIWQEGVQRQKHPAVIVDHTPVTEDHNIHKGPGTATEQEKKAIAARIGRQRGEE